MKINKFVAIGVIAFTVISVIAFLLDVQYQEAKRIARSEASALRLSCSFNKGYQRLAAHGKRRLEENPSDLQKQAELKQLEATADESAKACQKIWDYETKYNDTIDIPDI